MTDKLTDEDILAAGEGLYSDVKRFADGRAACVARMLYTCAILYDFNWAGHNNRWCYHTMADARRALAEWDGTGEPEGWHRNPHTGRRRTSKGLEYFQP